MCVFSTAVFCSFIRPPKAKDYRHFLDLCASSITQFACPVNISFCPRAQFPFLSYSQARNALNRKVFPQISLYSVIFKSTTVCLYRGEGCAQ